MNDLRMLIHINPEQGIDRSHLSVRSLLVCNYFSAFIQVKYSVSSCFAFKFCKVHEFQAPTFKVFQSLNGSRYFFGYFSIEVELNSMLACVQRLGILT